jgi:hypothetical protein
MRTSVSGGNNLHELTEQYRNRLQDERIQFSFSTRARFPLEMRSRAVKQLVQGNSSFQFEIDKGTK